MATRVIVSQPRQAGKAARLEQIVDLEKALRCVPFSCSAATKLIKAEIERLRAGGKPR